MARIDISGIEIDYELQGDSGAPSVVITPGGRYPKETAGVPELARTLAAAGKRVLLWEQLARNPGNRHILLQQDPDAFIEKMQQWAAGYAYSQASPVPGLTAADFSRLTMPVVVFRSGKSDLSHTRRTSEWIHELVPHSELIEPPWPDQEWNDCSRIPNEPGRGRFERWPLLAPQILDFLGR